MSLPLISIILPVFNGQKFLGEAIQSCLDQTYTNFELLIVNDASTDNSLEIAKEFEGLDTRIQIISNKENLKLPKSLNEGHRKAKGDFFSWTSHDNILKPTFLEDLFNAMNEQQCDLVYSNFNIIWEDGSFKRTQKGGLVEELVFGDVIGASFLYSRKVYEKLNGYRTDLFLVEDYDFFLRAATEFKFYHLDTSLYDYRLHSKSLTSKIQRDNFHTIKHRKALNKMYRRLGEKFSFDNKTINLLIKLYFGEKIAIEDYLKVKELIKHDLLIFESSIKSDRKCGVEHFLNYKIFWNWFGNRKEHSLSTFFQVLKIERSILFNPKSNRNSVIRLFLNCCRG